MRFIVPAVAGPGRVVPLAALTTRDLSARCGRPPSGDAFAPCATSAVSGGALETGSPSIARAATGARRSEELVSLGYSLGAVNTASWQPDVLHLGVAQGARLGVGSDHG